MAMTLDVRRPATLRAVLVALTIVAAGFLLSWSSAPAPERIADAPATPANMALDNHTWGTTGCFLPGAAIDAVPGLFDFRHACIHHGGCYQGLDRSGAPAVIDRQRCDELFQADLTASCVVLHAASTNWRARECESAAESYYAVARSFGGPYYTGSGDPT